MLSSKTASNISRCRIPRAQPERPPRAGRLGADLLREVIPDPTAALVYVCGPGISKWDREVAKEKGLQPAPRFLESVLANLKEIGVPNARIKREFYG